MEEHIAKSQRVQPEDRVSHRADVPRCVPALVPEATESTTLTPIHHAELAFFAPTSTPSSLPWPWSCRRYAK
eukprot:1431394-Pleurochrysis_carterae.AAC.1